MHNALQGNKDIKLDQHEKDLYEETAIENRRFTSLESYDCVVIHDPQPAPLINYYPRRLPWMFKPLPVIMGLAMVQKKQPWIWRCHVDLTNPSQDVFDFLHPILAKYDAIIVSSQKYRTNIHKPHHIIKPAIDPLSGKNIPLTEKQVEDVLGRFNIPLDKPIIAQVSRFDPWKDPLGVIAAYKRVRENTDCRLVLLGNTATDDPEGDVVYREVLRAAEGDDQIHVISFQSDELVNAVQRASTVIVQKSLREGFGLTVSEALWKGTPVVASNVGGIPYQIIDGKTGFLVDSIDSCAERINWLLNNPEMAKAMGSVGREHVRNNFLITRLLADYLVLFTKTIGIDPRIARAAQYANPFFVGNMVKNAAMFPVDYALKLTEEFVKTSASFLPRKKK